MMFPWFGWSQFPLLHGSGCRANSVFRASSLERRMSFECRMCRFFCGMNDACVQVSHYAVDVSSFCVKLLSELVESDYKIIPFGILGISYWGWRWCCHREYLEMVERHFFLNAAQQFLWYFYEYSLWTRIDWMRRERMWACQWDRWCVLVLLLPRFCLFFSNVNGVISTTLELSAVIRKPKSGTCLVSGTSFV